jgi:WD40 repeat protein
MVWSVDTARGSDSLELKLNHEVPVKGDVSQICTFGENLVMVTSSSGSASLYQLPHKQLEELNTWPHLHQYSCTDVVHNATDNSLLTCGQDGFVNKIPLDHLSNPIKSKSLTQCSLECIDILSPNEAICGTESGHIKVFDDRKGEAVLSLQGVQQSIITCIQRNPSIGHILATGNDSGHLSLWDLRNASSLLMHISAHDALITELQYKQNENNIVMTSSFDGQLLKWNLTPTCQLTSVESVMGREGGPSINSFHVNSKDQVVFGADNEVLYFGQL